MNEEHRRKSIAATASGAAEPPWPSAQPPTFMAGADRSSTPLSLKMAAPPATNDGTAELSARAAAMTSSRSGPIDREPDTASLALSPNTPVVDLPDVDSIPRQVPAASQFALDAEGHIDLVPDPPDYALLAFDSQREIYQEVRRKALALSALGHNQLADLSVPIGRFLAAAPERIEDISITRLWSRGNTLRLRLKAHDTAGPSADYTDPAHLPSLVAETLRDVVETYNIFMAGDPRGRELDHVRLGPQERYAAVATLDVASRIVSAVKASGGLATTTAVEALAEQVEAAHTAPPGIEGDQAIDLSRKTSSNFVLRRSVEAEGSPSGKAKVGNVCAFAPLRPEPCICQML
jgi:hypothetical protein